MALITRFSRLLRADMHAVLDRIEEPEVLLRQAVRDMEETVAEDEQRAVCLAEEQYRIGERRSQIARFIAESATELDLCLGAGREDLARTLLRRRLEHEALDAALDRRVQDLARDGAQLQRRLADHQERLAVIRQKAQLLTRQIPGDHAPDWDAERRAVREEDVELALLRELERRAPR